MPDVGLSPPKPDESGKTSSSYLCLDVVAEVLWTKTQHAYVQRAGKAVLCHQVVMLNACFDVMDNAIFLTEKSHGIACAPCDVHALRHGLQFGLASQPPCLNRVYSRRLDTFVEPFQYECPSID